MTVALELLHKESRVLWHVLPLGTTFVGRHVRCDLCLRDPAVEEIHFRVLRKADRVFFFNHSLNGTRIWTEFVGDCHRLADGDCIYLGQYVVRVCFRPTEASSVTRTHLIEPHKQSLSGLLVFKEVGHPGGREWKCQLPHLHIGSDCSNDIVLSNDPYVSRFHARVSFEENRCLLTDLGSRNGVWVDDTRITRGELGVGRTMRVGHTHLTLCYEKMSRQPEVKGDGAYGCTLIGCSPAMRETRRLITRLAVLDAPILVQGETGTGKEIVAHSIWRESQRSEGPFVVLNAGELSGELIHSELFGHEKGAFTGAIEARQGAFQVAHNGTLFLDEVGELPIALQPKLLRVLEGGEIRRVGAVKTRSVNVRLVAATNRDLHESVRLGLFREDLFHRMNVFTLKLPSLRDRIEDIPLLVEHFLREFNSGDVQLCVNGRVMTMLQSYRWPGNVRELRNVLLRAVCLRNSTTLTEGDIQFSNEAGGCEKEKTRQEDNKISETCRKLETIERDAIRDALLKHDGHRKNAALSLGISRSTIHRKIEHYRLF